jgi:hypothetical protein
MRNSLRFSIAVLTLAASAACSRSSEQPALSDDLKQDLARVGGSDVQLAGATNNRVDVVSTAERTESPVPAPKSPTVSRAPSAFRGTRAVVRSVRREQPVVAEPQPRAVESAPAEVRESAPAPEPQPSQSRPQAPRPSTQREPAGGWRSTSDVIRNSPFPINP